MDIPEAVSHGEGTSARRPRSAEDVEDMAATPDMDNIATKLQLAREVYEAYAGDEVKPSKGEVLGWYLYGQCSYFIHTVLIPIVFPLIISQTVAPPPEPEQGWFRSYNNFTCTKRETILYESIVHGSIKITTTHLSPLEWTSLSWFIGLILAAPVLGVISIHLDCGRNQQLIAGAATALGALSCLPAGFFGTPWIFPPYVAAIVAANTIASATHARHLGLMVRGFVGSIIRKRQFTDRRAVAGGLSLYATAAGCLGSSVMASFTYYMLRKSDSFTSLWVVSIFSGLIWAIGLSHVFSVNRPGPCSSSLSGLIPKNHAISIFKYPHAAGSLAGVFLSSFATMTIFTGGVLYSVGYLCLEQKDILYLWLTYFIFPLLSLPLAQPLQQLIRADAEKMQLMGFILNTLTSGFGFYFRHEKWQRSHIFVFAAIHGTATGLLHAFGRVLLLDCSPAGKEGAFSVWFSWIRALGTCAGFAFASAHPGNIKKSFGSSFIAAIIGMIILIFGNISSFGGAKAAGHVLDRSEKGSPVAGFDGKEFEATKRPDESEDQASNEAEKIDV